MGKVIKNKHKVEYLLFCPSITYIFYCIPGQNGKEFALFHSSNSLLCYPNTMSNICSLLQLPENVREKDTDIFGKRYRYFWYTGNLVKDILKMRAIVGFSCSVCCCYFSFPDVIYCLHTHTFTHTYKNSHWTSSLLSALKLETTCSRHFFPLPYMTAPYLWYETSSRQPFYFEESSLRGGFKVESHSSHCHKTRMLKETTRMQATRCLGWGKVFYNVKGCKFHSNLPEVIFSLTMFLPHPPKYISLFYLTLILF